MIRHSILALIFLIGLTTTGLAAPAAADETARDVSIGVLAFRGGEDAEYAWGPTLRHLSATLPQYRFRLIPLGPEKLYDAVRNRQIDFLISNPGQYVEQEAAHGIARIATVAFEGGPLPSEAIGSTVFVRKDRMDLRQWSDLKGKRLIAVSPDLFGGFRIAWREFAEHRIDPLADMASLHFSGFPVKQLFDAVARGDADVGIARGCALEELAAKGSIDPSLHGHRRASDDGMGLRGVQPALSGLASGQAGAYVQHIGPRRRPGPAVDAARRSWPELDDSGGLPKRPRFVSSP